LAQAMAQRSTMKHGNWSEAKLNKQIIQRINTEVQYTNCKKTPHGKREQDTISKNLDTIRVTWSNNSVVTCQSMGYLALSVRCIRTDKHFVSNEEKTTITLKTCGATDHGICAALKTAITD
jgi:hypothetical protein